MMMYQTGLYIRLSKETLKEKEAGTAQYQKEFLLNYISDKPEFKLVEVYEDIEYSGANFLRPAFLRLCGDIDAVRINCVIVKDFARLGRDYIEVGEYMDNLFAFQGVRLISVNDDFDSLKCTTPEAMVAALKNILNDLYLKTLSKNIRKVTKIKRERGDYPSGPGPYGYLRDEKNRNRLMVDEKTAPVVKKIFAMRLTGCSLKKIAQELTELGIQTPTQYRKSIGIIQAPNVNDNSRWNIATIRGMLCNPYYTGHTVNGRYQFGEMHERRAALHSEEKWTLVRNTHPAIIDEKDFDTIQRMFRESEAEFHKTYTKDGGPKRSIFPPILFCGHCGSPMKRIKIQNSEHKHRYKCKAHFEDVNVCTGQTVPESRVKEAVRVALEHYAQPNTGTKEANNHKPHVEISKNAEMIIKNNMTRIKEKKVQMYEKYKDEIISRMNS